MFYKSSLVVISFALANCYWLGRTIAFYRVFFQQEKVALGKWCIGPQKGHPRTPGMDFFCTVPRPHFLGRACSRSFWIIFFEFVKVCGIRFSIWESFIGFYICSYPIPTILACSVSVGVRISWKKLLWKGTWRRRWHLVSPTLYIIIVYRGNLNKLSRAIRATTTNCRVSFIDLYLVFPRNFRIVFLPHTNTVILLEPYCGTITEPWLRVMEPCVSCFYLTYCMEYVWKSSLWIGIQRTTQRPRILLTDWKYRAGTALVSTITSFY